MGVFPGGCYPDFGSELGFSDDGAACPGYEPEVEFIAAAGLEYLITVASWHMYIEGACGEVWLDISHTLLPLLADDCDGAGDDGPFIITEDQFDVFVNNYNADTDGPDDSFCNEGSLGGDIWFILEAWMDGYATANFLYMGWDANLEVYAGRECLALVNPRIPIRCNDDYGDPDDNPWDAAAETWPELGHGSWASWPVEAGQDYLIRLGGWYSPPGNPLSVGGMGHGFYDLWIDDFGPGPPNDFCADAVPTEITADVTTTFEGHTYWATWGDCEDVPGMEYKFVDAWDGPVWEAFTIPAGPCMDVQVDFCGTPEGPTGFRWNRSDDSTDPPNREGMTLWYGGCPCDGVVGIFETSSFWNTAECERNNGHIFEGIPAGDFYVQIDAMASGLDGPWDFYIMNVTGTEVECVYCEAVPNIASCPPVAGASWVSGVYLADMSNGGPSIPTDIGTGCHAYEDFTGVGPAHLYRGIPYELAIDMGKQGVAGEFDVCDAWVDWDQNSSWYNVGERYTPERLALTWTTMITAPLDAPLPGEGATGTTIMRIRMGSTNDGGNVPCGTSTWGEVEDYLIELMDLECGDFDMSGGIDAGDIQFLIDWYLHGGPAPDFWQRADIDGDGAITIADIIALVDAAYHGGALNCL
jgi:hypothetical protein